MSTHAAARRLRRSCLSVPGTQERFHAGAERSAADQIMFDLEDSVAPAAKDRARSLVVEALRKRDYGGRLLSVRVNGCDTRWCHQDVIAVVEGAGDSLDTLVVPKVEDTDQVHFLDTLLHQLEMRYHRDSRIGLELQIESARGMENAGAIADASERTETLIFGPADFAASIRAPELTVGRINRDYPGDFWHFFLARICVAARARGLQPIDGPYAEIGDLDGLRTSATRARMLGFDGKWAIHPSQVAVLNEVFAPTQDEFDRASAILDAYARAADVDQAGAVMFGEEMIDEASRKLADSMVERGRALGMSARPFRPAGR